jgi:hypothetical protein
MTQRGPQSGAIERLRELLARATPGPWAYRPQEYDDWGFIRRSETDDGWRPVVAISRAGEMGTEEALNEHRWKGTDPYRPNGELITEAVNALPHLLDTLDEQAARIKRLEAEVASLRGALTPSGDTKAAYIGEFQMGITLRARGEEEYRRVQIPWDTIKEIMAAIRERATLTKGPTP